jgi:hypothetical protein
MRLAGPRGAHRVARVAPARFSLRMETVVSSRLRRASSLSRVLYRAELARRAAAADSAARSSLSMWRGGKRGAGAAKWEISGESEEIRTAISNFELGICRFNPEIDLTRY